MTAAWTIKDGTGQLRAEFMGPSALEVGRRIAPTHYDAFRLHVSPSYREVFDRAVAKVLAQQGWQIVKVRARAQSPACGVGRNKASAALRRSTPAQERRNTASAYCALRPTFRHAPSVPRGKPRKIATGRGCLLGNPGAASGGPRRPARASWRALARLSGDLTIPKGCLSAPAFGDF